MLKLLIAALTFAAADSGGNGLPSKSPAAVGMSSERLAAIDRVVSRGIAAGGYPGAAVVVGRKGYAVYERGFGHLDWTHGQPVEPSESVYDLASLSKVIGTTTAIMVLFDEGKVQLDEPVHTYLPEFTGGYKDSVTVRQLLMHRGGLPAGRELWRIAHTPEEARAAVLATPLEYRPGTAFIYSDLGADLLGFIVEAAAGEPMDRFLEEKVYGPLGMKDTGYRPSAETRDRTAPTEIAPPRGYPLRGEVHDENAYALGGVAGHAGLFGTAADLSIFAQMLLNGGEYDGVRVIADSTIRLFTHKAAGNRALGWAVAEGQWGSGRFLSDNAFGHVGYTGTSLWIDPDRQMFVILLTNRVHAARARRPSKVIADVRADLADAASLAVMDSPDGPLAMPAAFRADRAEGWNRAERTASRHKSSRRHSSSSKSHASKSSSSHKSASSKSSSSRSRSTKSSSSRSSSSKSSHAKTTTTKKKTTTRSRR